MKLVSMNISKTKLAIRNSKGDNNEPSMLACFFSIQLG